MNKTHRDTARDFLSKGNIKQALKLAKTFDVTYNKSEISILEIAYESLCGRSNFYKQLNVDVEDNIKKAKMLLGKLNK